MYSLGSYFRINYLGAISLTSIESSGSRNNSTPNMPQPERVDMALDATCNASALECSDMYAGAMTR